MSNHQELLEQCRQWVEKVIVACNFCPFAKKEVVRNTIRYQLLASENMSEVLHRLVEECVYLDEHPEIETTLVVLPEGFDAFEDFLELIDMSDQLLQMQGYEGIYQFAHFHPKYCFADALQDDPANYTNRSPAPMLHLIREESMERAIANYPGAEDIPERNIQYARDKGLPAMQELLESCKQKTH
jgi:hypothetical protein